MNFCIFTSLFRKEIRKRTAFKRNKQVAKATSSEWYRHIAN